MPFKETHKKQLQLVSDCGLQVKPLERCPEIVFATLSQSSFIEASRVDLITQAVAKRVRGLRAYLGKN